MISLEARRFWLLGLLPVPRETILWSKFLFAAGGSVLPCCLLVFLSDLMLRVAPLVLAIHQTTCILLCVGLSGIAVGLGARMPNLREQSPARIAAGFGGTLNLVLSAVYILVMVMLTALPCHFYLVAAATPVGNLIEDRNSFEWWLKLWIILGMLGAVVLGTAATIVPMRLGFRTFRETEF
jgi:ABC-2 type transport system permease protein